MVSGHCKKRIHVSKKCCLKQDILNSKTDDPSPNGRGSGKLQTIF